MAGHSGMACDWSSLEDVLSQWEEPVLGCEGLAHGAGGAGLNEKPRV